MQTFNARLGAEILRTGSLRQEFVDELLQKLKNGEIDICRCMAAQRYRPVRGHLCSGPQARA
jgi:hypothetical protein